MAQTITDAVHQVYKEGKSERDFLTELLAILCPGAAPLQPKKKKIRRAVALPKCEHCTVTGDHISPECPVVAAMRAAEKAEGKPKVADAADDLAAAMGAMAIERPRKVSKPRKVLLPSPVKEKTEYELEVEAAAPVLAEKVKEMERGWTPEWQISEAEGDELTQIVWKAETYQVDKIGAIYKEGEHVGHVGVDEFVELRV